LPNGRNLSGELILNLRHKTVVTVISKIGDRKPTTDACLVVIYGHSLGHKFTVKSGEMVIGRSSQAHIQIDHESVSRRHAKVVAGKSRTEVVDLESTNGTYVNDDSVQTRALRDGDLIKVGRTILKYLANDNVEMAYHEEISKLARIDGLTRCFNRRFIRDQLSREISRCTRYGRALSVLIFDINGFQYLNDQYGHLAGDAILAQMGKRISRRVRREDILGRYGGGEFTILSPEADGGVIAMLAERLQSIVADGSFGFEETSIPVEICVGYASLSEIDIESTVGDLSVSDAFEVETGHDIGEAQSTDLVVSGGAKRFFLIGETLLDLARSRMQEAKQDR
jgi:two-component system, cell cycle response regulator